MFDPWDDFRRFEEMMNRMFEQYRGRPERRLLPSGERGEVMKAGAKQPFIDLLETDKEVIATAEIPGIEKKDIKIELTEDRLEVSAETKHEEKKEDEGYVYRERHTGSYYRSISLPSPIDPDNAKATFKNGVLEIKMQKTEVKKKKPLEIE